MLARNDDDFPSRDKWWALSPGQRDRFVRGVIVHARLEQAKAMRALARALILTGPKAIGVAILRAIVHGWTVYRTWRKRRQGIAELRALDDRHLKDIGLRRGEIESVIYGLAGDASRHARSTPVSSPRARNQIRRSAA